MAANPEFKQFAWMPPRAYTLGRPQGAPLWVVLHYTAGAERVSSAEDGAAYDQRRTDGTSAHFYVDQNSVVQCIATWDRSHTALYNGNMRGIHIEMCGTIQSRAQWLDAASRPTIRNTAMVAALCMKKYGMPNHRLTAVEVAGKVARGYTDHGTITKAFPSDGGDHTDVGAAFPWDVFAADLNEFMEDGPMDINMSQIVPRSNRTLFDLLTDVHLGVHVPSGMVIAALARLEANAAKEAVRDAALLALVQSLSSASGASIEESRILNAIAEAAEGVRKEVMGKLESIDTDVVAEITSRLES